MENVVIFHRHIYEMCEQENVCFLNVQEALVDDEGYLPGGAASDGIHMRKEYCMKWLEYIKCILYKINTAFSSGKFWLELVRSYSVFFGSMVYYTFRFCRSAACVRYYHGSLFYCKKG